LSTRSLARTDDIFMTVAKSVKKEGSFSYPGFGTFKLKKRKARMGRNPQTGDQIRIAASKTISFKPMPSLKDTL
jgi:DNA-binding protein HU-beta